MDDRCTSSGVRASISKRLDGIHTSRRKLDEEEVQLKMRWNSSVPINRLPNEIICNLLVLYEQNRDGPTRVPFNMAWVRIISVCRYWYRIACGTPSLWNIIEASGGNVAWLDLCLTRSAQTSLDISLDDPFDELLKSVASQVTRIKNLKIQEFDAPRALSFLHGPMPLLEKLDLSANDPKDTTDFFEFDMTPRHYPLLRDLSIEGVDSIPSNLGMYAGLRKLSLRACGFNTSMVNFCHILSACTHLESLYLSDFLSGLDETIPALDRPPISVPRLATLFVSEECHCAVADFLAHVILSPATEATVRATFHLEDADDTPRMSAILPANRATTFPALSTVTHVYLHMRHAHYTMQVSLESDLVPSIYVTTTLALVSDDIEDWENYLESCGLWDLVEIFAGTPLTYLSIEGDFDSVMGPDWKTAFLAFPTLEVLKCEASDESSPTAVWAALALDAAAQEILCPRLRRITMHGCRMEGRGRADVFFEKMFACLTSRAAGGGTRLQKLDLEVQSLGEELDAKLKRKYPADLLGSVDVVKFRLKG